MDVWVEHPKGVAWPCPEYGRGCSLYDHSPERVWRHLDSCQFMTYFHASPPRVNCPEHGVKQVNLPWAEGKARFTILFESLAITVLSRTDIKEAATILRISWDEAMHIMERAVARGLAAKPEAKPKRVGVDEKAVGRGQNYFTVVWDLDRGVVDAVLDGRTKGLLGYFKALCAEEIMEEKSSLPISARRFLNMVVHPTLACRHCRSHWNRGPCFCRLKSLYSQS